MRVDKTRNSAKATIEDLANELLARKNDPDVRIKLQVIEKIALRMGWVPLYTKLRFQSGLHAEEPAPEKWFQK